MNSNGNYSLSPEPSPEDAAAVIAAIERFLAETSTPELEPVVVVNGWLRAALHEGIGRPDENKIW